MPPFPALNINSYHTQILILRSTNEISFLIKYTSFLQQMKTIMEIHNWSKFREVTVGAQIHVIYKATHTPVIQEKSRKRERMN